MYDHNSINNISSVSEKPLGKYMQAMVSLDTFNPLFRRYGLCNLPLNALQRDSSTLDVTMKDQVGEQTQEQLKKIIQVYEMRKIGLEVTVTYIDFRRICNILFKTIFF